MPTNHCCLTPHEVASVRLPAVQAEAKAETCACVCECVRACVNACARVYVCMCVSVCDSLLWEQLPYFSLTRALPTPVPARLFTRACLFPRPKGFPGPRVVPGLFHPMSPQATTPSFPDRNSPSTFFHAKTFQAHIFSKGPQETL